MSSAKSQLGRGWSMPLLPQAKHGIDSLSLLYAEGAEKIRQSIKIILDTEPGERVMRPTFGCGLRRYLMKPNSAAVRASIQADVQRALTQFEPRIDVLGVQVVPSDEEPSRIDIHIRFQLTRDRR